MMHIIHKRAAYGRTGGLAPDCSPDSSRFRRSKYLALASVLTAVWAGPGAAEDLRPQTRYTYTSLYAWYKNSSGTVVQAATPIYLLTAISTCRTTASCAGTADETITTINYGPTTGAANNLLPVSSSSGAGNGSLTATVTTTYDDWGNAIAVDGPLGGTGDKNIFLYDSIRQMTQIVGPDPDGGGALLNRSTKYSYDPDGQLTVTARGTANADGSGFVELQRTTADYDSIGRQVKATLAAGSTTYSLVQNSYDAANRLDCTAQRMNPSLFASPPSNVCLVGTQGSYGPDRITRNSYDAADQLTKITTGYTSGSSIDLVSYSYTPNGKVETLDDGNTNRTTFVYDGFDRLSRTRYPNTTGGGSSTTDYEELSYDAASNVVNRRLRNMANIGYSYDRLNHLTGKTLPTGTGNPTPAYSYDLVGNMLTANNSQSAPSYSNGTSFEWDALGRKTKETSTYGGTNAIVKTMEYDLAGRQTKFAWPDLYVTYEYDNANDLTKIKENGSTTLFTFTYDDLGRRIQKDTLNNNNMTYGYDAASRLTSMVLSSFNGTTITLSDYSPAGEIGSRVSTNDLYAAAKPQNGTTSYTPNGLNQYGAITSTAPIAVGYDLKQNMSKFAGKTLSFGAENTITTGGPSSYWHDALNRITYLTQKGLRFDWDGDNLVGIYSGTTLLRRYVYEPGATAPSLWYESGSPVDRRFMDADERGSIIRVSGNSGGTIRVNTYDEYGVPGANNLGRFGYTGHIWLPEAGMYYARNRMYEPKLGRFMQTDPIGYDDGPNIYAYVHNDPINLIDPTGTDYCGDGSDDICVPGDRIIFGVGRGPGSTAIPGSRDNDYNPSIIVDTARKPQNNNCTQSNRGGCQEKQLPKCAQDFLRGRIAGDPGNIRFHRGGSIFNAFGNSVTYGSDIYLSGNTFFRSGAGALTHKFHEIAHTSQNARLGLSALHHGAGYAAFGGHDASPLEQSADDFAQATFDAYQKAGLDKTCPF